MFRGRVRRSNGNGMLYVLVVQALTQFARLERKPPVTATLVLANAIIFLRPGKLDVILPTIHQACLNPHLVLKNVDLKRLFLSAFYHLDETHLVYNMSSLLWKGVQLEGRMGSGNFALMVAVLLGLSHSLVVLVAKGLSVFAGYPDALFSDCAVGFSTVLFALKVVLNWDSPTYTNVSGVRVPARHAAWVELLLIQMFVPGTSFLGHLSGILAGLFYVHLSHLFSRRGPVRRGLRLARLFTPIFWPVRFLSKCFIRLGGRTSGRGVVGTTNHQRHFPEGASVVWCCPACTYNNLVHVIECEMCGTLHLGVNNFPPSAPPLPSTEASTVFAMEDMRQA